MPAPTPLKKQAQATPIQKAVTTVMMKMVFNRAPATLERSANLVLEQFRTVYALPVPPVNSSILRLQLAQLVRAKQPLVLRVP